MVAKSVQKEESVFEVSYHFLSWSVPGGAGAIAWRFFGSRDSKVSSEKRSTGLVFLAGQARLCLCQGAGGWEHVKIPRENKEEQRSEACDCLQRKSVA